MKAKHRVLWLSMLLCVLMLFALVPVTAHAASDPESLVFDISEGSVIIDEGTESGTIKVTYGNEQVKDGISPSETITVTGSFSKTADDDTGHQLIVYTSASIKASNLTINNAGFYQHYAMVVRGENTSITLTLEDENTFTAGTDYPGIAVFGGNTLTIQGDGALTVQAGDGSPYSGIYVSGSIVISGGTVNAYGARIEQEGKTSDGIKVMGGSITINGGTVNAIGGSSDGQTIQSTGIYLFDSALTITGGTVTAQGLGLSTEESCSVGIDAANYTSSITITGGTVNAIGGVVSGNNGRSWGIYTPTGSVTISDDAEVTAAGSGATETGAMNKAPTLGSDMKVSIGMGGPLYPLEYSFLKDGVYSYCLAVKVEPCTSHVLDDSGWVPVDEDTHSQVCKWCGPVNRKKHAFDSDGVCPDCGAWKGNYLDADGAMQTHIAAPLAADTTFWSEGWYVALGDVTIPGTVSLEGDVHLILADGCDLTISSHAEGMGIEGEGNLTIYSQSTGSQMGRLTVTAAPYRWSCGIGLSGDLTMNGGNVKVTSGAASASDGYALSVGISVEGYYDSFAGQYLGGNLTVNGGNIIAESGSVNSGQACSQGISAEVSMTVNGGTVTATSGNVALTVDEENSWSSSTGIITESLTIHGGTITATGGTAAGRDSSSCGICCSYYDDGYGATSGMIISGGTVIATGDKADAESYGIYAESYHIDYNTGEYISHGTGSIDISGGNVTARTLAASGKAMNTAPNLNGYGVYLWRTAEGAAYTTCTDAETGYPYSGGHTYVEITPPCFAVTLASCDGSEPIILYTDADGQLTALPAPTRSGYRFDGWFTSKEGGEKVTETAFTADITLYAHWTKDIVIPSKPSRPAVPSEPEEIQNGWQKTDGVWYYYMDGAFATGWQKVDGSWYYLNADGSMKANGWVQWNGSWYYLTGSGSMAANSWVLWNGSWYYLTGDGSMAANSWVLWNGQWYYLTGDGSMAVSTVMDGWKVDATGAWIR